jgi:hypothetical protein
LTGSHQVIVDQTVAIVVDTITDLWRGRTSGRRALQARAIGFTHQFTVLFTGPNTCITRQTFVGPIFIDLAIAIIVDAIALFWLWCFGLHRACDAISGLVALPYSGIFARAHTDSARSSQLWPRIIDDAIAVVVEAIASLFLWLGSVAIYPLAIVTGLLTGATGCTAIAD